MSDQAPHPQQSEVCDGKDHGVTAARLAQLHSEARAYNELLRVDALGSGHDAAAGKASSEFYKYLSATPDATSKSNDPAFDASKAFYEQLAELPVGEAKALAKLTMQENQLMVAADKAMPRLHISMESDSFIDKMTVDFPYPMEYDFHYLGRCTEFKPWNGVSPGATPGIELPGLGLRLF